MKKLSMLLGVLLLPVLGSADVWNQTAFSKQEAAEVMGVLAAKASEAAASAMKSKINLDLVEEVDRERVLGVLRKHKGKEITALGVVRLYQRGEDISMHEDENGNGYYVYREETVYYVRVVHGSEMTYYAVEINHYGGKKTISKDFIVFEHTVPFNGNTAQQEILKFQRLAQEFSQKAMESGVLVADHKLKLDEQMHSLFSVYPLSQIEGIESVNVIKDRGTYLDVTLKLAFGETDTLRLALSSPVKQNPYWFENQYQLKLVRNK